MSVPLDAVLGEYVCVVQEIAANEWGKARIELQALNDDGDVVVHRVPVSLARALRIGDRVVVTLRRGPEST